MNNLQKISLFFYILLIPFASIKPFGVNIDFFIFKISFLFFVICNINIFFISFSKINNDYLCLLYFFLFYTINNYFNKPNIIIDSFDNIGIYFDFFDLMLFLNLISFHIIYYQLKKLPKIPNFIFYSIILSGLILSIFILFNFNVEIDSFGRTSLIGENSNVIGFSLAFSCIVAIAVLFEFKSITLFKVINIFIILIIFLALAKTGSRAAVLSLFSIVFLFSRKNNRFLSFIYFLIFLVLVFLFYLIIASEELILSRLYETVDSGDVSGRDVLVISTLPLLLENILFGVGITGFATYTETQLGFFFNPHNTLIEVLLYTGIFGFFLFGYWVYMVIKKSIILKRKFQINIFITLLLLFILVLLSGQFFQSKLMWCYTAILFAVYDIKIRQKSILGFYNT